MFVLVFVLFISFHGVTCYSFVYKPWYRRNEPLNLNLTHFHRLESYHVNAKAAYEYPWIARVIHSRSSTVPYLCTATCVDQYIFITTARCVYVLKIKYTSILYQGKRLTVKALVTPSEESKQLYDDIGFIIINDDGLVNKFYPIEVFKNRRTDDAFKWFTEMKLAENKYKVVGYARQKSSSAYPMWHNRYDLTELDIVMNMEICPTILPYSKEVPPFNVPCYHSCTIRQFQAEHDLCRNYHGVDGGAVVNEEGDLLFAIATWGFYHNEFELPVGVAMVNSDNYFDDCDCAKKIRNSQKKHVSAGFYQSLCN